MAAPPRRPPRLDGGSVMLAQALAYAARGWPVFPCKPRGKAPAIPSAHPEGDPLRGTCTGECGRQGHGFHDATTDPGVIRAWWRRWPAANVAIRTGAPAIDVLDVDRKPDGDGFAALNRLKRAGLLTGASGLVLTRSRGLHVYFTGTGQGCGKLKRHHLDFKASGGYVLAPPSYVAADAWGPAGTYELIEERDAAARLDWQAVKRLLDPPQETPRFQQPGRSTGSVRAFDDLIRYLSGLKDGDQRWKNLYAGACEAARRIAAGDLSGAEARQALMKAARANGFIDDHGEHQALAKIDRGLKDGAP
jgi:hypothetical protein